MVAGLIFWASLIALTPICYDPPTEEAKQAVEEFKKFQDESVQIKTETAVGTFSMAISGVSLGEGASGKLELGIAHIADLGGIVPRRIEITPFVYNQVGVSEQQGIELSRDQGAGLKIQMGNADREWAVFVKGSVSADQLLASDADSDSVVPAILKFGLTRSFGAGDPERLSKLGRLRRLKKPVVVTVSNEDFDRIASRTSEDIRLIHRAIMTTYLPEAVEYWLQQNKDLKHAEEDLESYLATPPRMYEFLRRQLVEGRPLYVESIDQRQRMIRPTRYEQGVVSKDAILFDSNQMVMDFVVGIEVNETSPEFPNPSSPQSSHPKDRDSP
jgi:hypothetical protein